MFIVGFLNIRPRISSDSSRTALLVPYSGLFEFGRFLLGFSTASVQLLSPGWESSYG